MLSLWGPHNNPQEWGVLARVGVLHSANVERPLQGGQRGSRTSGPQTHRRPQRVAMRPTTVKVDCRKAAGEFSFPENGLSLNTLDVDINTIIRNEHSAAGSNAIFSQGSNALKITIRSENEADRLAVEVLTREAFWNLYEARLR